MSSVKREALRLIEELSEEATWDDLMYELYVKQKIDAGLRAAAEGRIVTHEQAKRRLLGDAN